MTREEALDAIKTGSTHGRLKAARALLRNAVGSDLRELKRALGIETVSYVKSTLERAIARLENLPRAAPPDGEDDIRIPEDIRRQAESRATKWIAGLLLHEVGAPIGLVKLTASREIPNYEVSRTRMHLENLERIFEAIEQLKGATAAPKPERFDLAELIAAIANELDEGLTSTSLLGPKPFLITSDPVLLRLVIVNGLRNAAEAASDIEADPVVVAWGQTDIDYWVSILDKGPGIVGPSEAAFGIGKTTKKGHSGFGLAVARQAIETLGGTVTLEPAAQGGAKYEARWER